MAKEEYWTKDCALWYPESTEASSECTPSSWTLILRLVRCSQAICAYDAILIYSRRSCGTVSNALEKSRIAMSN
jgi:hypothetical protein